MNLSGNTIGQRRKLGLLLGSVGLLAIMLAACAPGGLPAEKAPERTAWAATRAVSTVSQRAPGQVAEAATRSGTPAAEDATPTSRPTPSVTPTSTPSPTPLIVTPEIRPQNVLEAATLAAQKTAVALVDGTATPTPRNMVTATFTPRPFVITPTFTPGSKATAEYSALLATAEAFTTGTPTPFPTWVVQATQTPLPTAWPKATNMPPTPTYTPTAIWVAMAQVTRWAEPTATPVPAVPPALMGKILFMSDYTGSNQAFAINPDGTGMVMLTSSAPYNVAAERDAYSFDRTYRTFPERDKEGQIRLYQIYYYDSHFSVKRQMSAFGVGTAWDPAWSPVDDLVAFVSNESNVDEIWVARKDQLPPQQLTHSTWEWNHHPTWSPDGKQIAFMSNRGGKQQIWIMDANGRSPHSITDWSFEAWDPVWTKYTN